MAAKSFLACHLETSKNTPLNEDPRRVFTVTHPFHPLFKKEFVLVEMRINWGEQRIFFVDEEEKLISLPRRWTSMAEEDLFLVLSNGRAYFRTTDLLQIRALLDMLQEKGSGQDTTKSLGRSAKKSLRKNP